MRSTTSAIAFALMLGACSGPAGPSAPIADAPTSVDSSLPPASAPVATSEPTTTSTTATSTTSPDTPESPPTSDPPAIDVAALSLDEVDQLLAELDDQLADLHESFDQQEGVDIDG